MLLSNDHNIIAVIINKFPGFLIFKNKLIKLNSVVIINIPTKTKNNDT